MLILDFEVVGVQPFIPRFVLCTIFQFVEHCGYGWGIPVLNAHTKEKITKNVRGDAYVRN